MGLKRREVIEIHSFSRIILMPDFIQIMYISLILSAYKKEQLLNILRGLISGKYIDLFVLCVSHVFTHMVYEQPFIENLCYIYVIQPFRFSKSPSHNM